MKKIRFNTGWKYIEGVINPFAAVFGDISEGKEVTLPHDAMIYEKRDPDCPSQTQSGFYPAKTYTYTKTFHAPSEWEGLEQILEFEGVMGRTSVYINGNFAASNENGYLQFFVDMKPFLRYGEDNEIKVIAANTELASRWYPGSGIYRDVNLYTGGDVWIAPEGLRLTTEYIEDDYALVRADVKLKTSSAGSKQILLRVSFIDENGRTAAEGATEVTVRGMDRDPVQASLRISVTDPALWSPDEPKLYLCKAEVISGGETLDCAEEEFGIRTIRMDARRGLRINGETVKMRGCCIHHDNGILGAATLYQAEEFRARNLKAAGFNAIRSSHNPMGKTMLSICDRLGILVMDELGDMWNDPKNCYDRHIDFSKNWEDEVSRMISKDYNHPCVVMYSTGNEIPEIGNDSGRSLNRRIVSLMHQLDPGRYTTNAINGMLAVSDRIGEYIEELSAGMQREAKAGDGAVQGGSPVEGGSSGGSEGLNAAMALMEKDKMDAFTVSPLMSDALEEASGTLDAAGFNYLTARHEKEHPDHPDRVIVGSETFPSEIADLWEIVMRNPHVIGDFTWTGYDYLGEAGIGIFHYGEPKAMQGWYPDRLAYCGDININGYRRPASYLRETAYGLRDRPFIAVDRPEHYGEPHDSNEWKYGDAVDSWTYTGFEGKPVRIRVISDAEEAELILNGRSLGRKKIGEEEKLTAYFETEYEPGELEAVCYTAGAEPGRSSLKTAGAPADISVQTVNPVIASDGSGVAFLIAELTDENGEVNRCDNRKISVKVEGAGCLAGFGSADPSCEGSYQDSEWLTYDGRVMAAVRSTGEPGEIHVTFTAEALPQTQLILTAAEQE